MFKIILGILISHYLILFFDFIYKKIKPFILFRISKKSKQIVSLTEIMSNLSQYDNDFWED